jgi:L-serine dehydratase
VTYVSLFEVLRRSPGPSSTHTAGPYHAARRFVHELAATGRLPSVVRLGVELYGGAACAGRENGAAGALVAGLEGLAIDACDAASFASRLDDARTSRSVALDARHRLVFDPDTDIGFRVDRAPVYDGNAVRFAAFDRSGVALVVRAYLAAGADRVVAPDEADSPSRASRVPYDYATAEDLLRHCRNAGRRIAVVALANEAALRAPAEVRARLGSLHDTMRGLVTRGLEPAPGDRARPRAAPRRAPRLDDPGASPAERCEILAARCA